MFLVDTAEERSIISNEEIKHTVASAEPYAEWVDRNMVDLGSLPERPLTENADCSQVFEAVGLNSQIVDAYFLRTPTRIEGSGSTRSPKGSVSAGSWFFRLSAAMSIRVSTRRERKWHHNGEYHLFSPEAIHLLQYTCRTGNYELFKEYENLIDDQSEHLCTIRGLMDINFSGDPIPIEKVEPAENILRRFKTGAMSYGSISQEAHEALAIAIEPGRRQEQYRRGR